LCSDFMFTFIRTIECATHFRCSSLPTLLETTKLRLEHFQACCIKMERMCHHFYSLIVNEQLTTLLS